MKPPPCTATAGKTDHGIHRRVLPDDVDQLPELALHGLKGNAAVGA
ncbi:hypothetical protein LP414_29490 [Polaromonas sp. P1(28)-13]|nr:hypothetical protein LP414_29490 [Polaromonas sp. P1(28)-13]